MFGFKLTALFHLGTECFPSLKGLVNFIHSAHIHFAQEPCHSTYDVLLEAPHPDLSPFKTILSTLESYINLFMHPE